jgi:hypothetical protein
MKKLLFVCLLSAMTPALAQQWVPYSQTSKATQYFDLQRAITMGGSAAFILDLHDMKSEENDADGKTYRSIVYAMEFNCRKEQRRVLSFQKMSESMGTGSVVSEQSHVGEWMEVKTPAIVRLMMAACQHR